MLHALIMAGGSGTRFWPESRALRPKQLLKLSGERTMIQSTLARLEGLVPPERTLVMTSAALVEPVREQLPQLPPESVVGEPCKRDTAPCIGLAALLLSHRDPQATMVVLPSDQVIRQQQSFRSALQFAAELVDSVPPGRIVTFGVRPSYAAESFGYIQRGEEFEFPNSKAGETPDVYRVTQFREKPAAEVARQYLASGDFYWNAGVFVFKAAAILDALARHQPKMYKHLARIGEAVGREDFSETLAGEFSAIAGTSIDYAVMEHAEDVLVVEAPFDWDDAGSWQALVRLSGSGDHAEANTVSARHLGLNTAGSIIRGQDGHLIATLGVRDLIIVQTADATLVANKHDEESIRQLVKLIEENGWREYL